jgi:microcystin-dependent protein
MGSPYIGEIRMFAGTFAPNGWAFCNGQPLAISEYETLFVLIGTIYGGDGETTFNVPNLSSRIPIHMGTGPGSVAYQIGQMAGTEQETLSTQQIPVHTHNLMGSTQASDSPSPLGTVTTKTAQNIYNNSVLPDTALSPTSIGLIGGSQPHNNCQPFLCINYIISLFGVFPNRS